MACLISELNYVLYKKNKKNQNKLLINQRKEENMSKHSPRILVDCVERKKAWFLALMFERQNVIVKNWGENLREWFSSWDKKNEVLMRSLVLIIWFTDRITNELRTIKYYYF